eukprot:SAG31_NODE_3356_length_4367_cov_5.456888_3_plen_37_part_00
MTTMVVGDKFVSSALSKNSVGAIHTSARSCGSHSAY